MPRVGELAGKAWVGLDRSPALAAKRAVNGNAGSRRQGRAGAPAVSGSLYLYARCRIRAGFAGSSHPMPNRLER
jgi:hypothetical protein